MKYFRCIPVSYTHLDVYKRQPQHREFIINFPDTVDNAKANEGWAKLQQIVEDYKKAHNLSLIHI